jgi:hypothetical protein
MKTKTLLASMALASLALAQPVSAATRSSDSLPQRGVQATQSVERAGSLAGEAEDVRGSPLVVILIITAILAALLLATTGGKSPG